MVENPKLATAPQGVGGGLRGSGIGLFLKRWASNPRRIGAILPSAKPLARIMANASVETRYGAGPVVELGPGTGSITRALLASGIAEEELVLIERDRELCRWLEHRFPGAVVIEGEAARIRALLGERATGTPSVVVSSLPLRNLEEDERDAIIRESVDVLPHPGAVVQFTYARHPAISGERLGVERQRVGFAPLNVPPASVWRIRRLHGRTGRPSTELVFIAGQYGSKTDGAVVSTAFAKQVRDAFRNLSVALAAHGLDLSHVVQLRTHVVNHDFDKLAAIAEAVRSGWGGNPPTHTLIGVASQATPEILFEVEAVAARS